MTNSKPLLVVEGLTKSHGSGPTRVEPLVGVNMTVDAGEFVAVTGASGSGKSTLLHLIAGLERPTSGAVYLEGRDLARLDDDARAVLRRDRIGLVFQSFHLFDTLTALENVALPLAIAGRPAAEADRRARAALDDLGLTARCHHRPCQLSGGEQQRVALARALVINPALLLADEPTGNLDSRHGSQVIVLLRRLATERRQTVLLVTHDAGHASLADRVLRLHDGRISEGRSRRATRHSRHGRKAA